MDQGIIGYITAAALGVIVITIFLHIRRNRSYTYHERYLFENTFLMLSQMPRLLDFLFEASESHGKLNGNNKTLHINTFGMPDIVVTNTVENVTYILKGNFETYGKGPIFKSRFQALLGDGIFNTDGDKWYKHRKTSAHLFNTNKFKTTVLDTFNRHCDVLVDIINKHAAAGKDGESFDIASLMFKFTLDSIGFIAFGCEIGALHQDRVPFADAFDVCQETINQSFLDPLWVLKRIFTPAGWDYYRCIRMVDSYAMGVVANKRKMVEKEAAKNEMSSPKRPGGGDLLSLYLDRNSMENGDGTSTLSDRALRDVVLNFVIAGRDTTAQALSWCFYRLCIHPEVQSSLRADIIRTMKGGSSGKLSYEMLQSMCYLEAFCMEVLRLHPSVPKEAKYAGKDDTFPDGTRVKKGDIIVFAPWLMGRTEEIWKNALEFQVNRHYTTTDAVDVEPNSANMTLIKHSPFAYTAFQAGPRLCLGMNLALLEMKCCLVRLLTDFEFSLAQPKESVTYVCTITLPIKGGLAVKAKKL